MKSLDEADATAAVATDSQGGNWGRPGIVAGLWLIEALLNVQDQIFFPDDSGPYYVSSVLFYSGIPVLMALIGSAIVRRPDRALPLAAQLLLLSCAIDGIWLFVQFALQAVGVESTPGLVLAGLASIFGSLWILIVGLGRDDLTFRRKFAAVTAGMFALILLPSITKFDGKLYALSASVAARSDASDSYVEIDEEKLWTSQPQLVREALGRITRDDHEPNRYLVSVGAGGSQQLFGREARYARTSLDRLFETQGRSVVLANDEASLYRVPLANNANLDAILAGLASKGDPKRDLFIFYLTSHGSREAELTTDLPDYDRLAPISAHRLAKALDQAGIKRRIIIVSACYAGSWIEPLASEDTIVLTAARSDRTSFGCSDSRELTYFGEAFLKPPTGAGQSLARRFDVARRSIARWEAKALSTHSEPQAYVGRNMRSLWNANP